MLRFCLLAVAFCCLVSSRSVDHSRHRRQADLTQLGISVQNTVQDALLSTDTQRIQQDSQNVTALVNGAVVQTIQNSTESALTASESMVIEQTVAGALELAIETAAGSGDNLGPEDIAQVAARLHDDLLSGVDGSGNGATDDEVQQIIRAAVNDAVQNTADQIGYGNATDVLSAVNDALQNTTMSSNVTTTTENELIALLNGSTNNNTEVMQSVNVGTLNAAPSGNDSLPIGNSQNPSLQFDSPAENQGVAYQYINIGDPNTSTLLLNISLPSSSDDLMARLQATAAKENYSEKLDLALKLTALSHDLMMSLDTALEASRSANAAIVVN